MLEARTLKRLAKPCSTRNLNKLYAAEDMWGDENFVLFEAPPDSVTGWAREIHDAGRRQIQEKAHACTNKVWPVEILAPNEFTTFVRFSRPDAPDIWVQARYVSTAIKRAKRNTKALQFYTDGGTHLLVSLLEPIALICRYDLERPNPDDMEWNLKNEDIPTRHAYQVPDLDMAQVAQPALI